MGQGKLLSVCCRKYAKLTLDGQPMLFPATRLGIDLKLFSKLETAEGTDLTCEELAKWTGCDEVLLSM